MSSAFRQTDDLIEFAFDSLVARDVPSSALQRVALGSLEANPRSGLTGELRLRAGRLSQVTEGRSAVLLPLAARILADPRHQSIRVLRLAPIGARRFGDWTVAGFGLDTDAVLPEAANVYHLALRPVAARPAPPRPEAASR